MNDTLFVGSFADAFALAKKFSDAAKQLQTITTDCTNASNQMQQVWKGASSEAFLQSFTEVEKALKNITPSVEALKTEADNKLKALQNIH